MEYSIIIPHKNTPNLLKRCLESIPIREDTEIIVVDDNSDGTIVDFNNFPGLNRKNVSCIFTKEGRGAGFARNVGLEQAIGNWVFFADADDILTDKFNAILDKYCQANADMVFLNALSIDEIGNVSNLSVNQYVDNYLRGRVHSLDVLRFGFWAPWSRLIKRNVFSNNTIKFEEVKVGNDALGILFASYAAKSFAVEDEICYYYYKPSFGSQTKKAYNHTLLSRLEQRLVINDLYDSWGYPYKWPIFHCFSLKDIDKSDLFEVLKKYKYNRFKDLQYYFRYCLAKVRKII